MSTEQEYRCGCGALLTPTEVAQHVEQLRVSDAEIEQFQRNLAQCLDPLEDEEDAWVIPDTAPEDLVTIAKANDEMPVPDWRAPICHACRRSEAFLEALRNPDGWSAETVMWMYHEGLCGCVPNSMMAYTWAYVALTWWQQWEDESPDSTGPDHRPPIQEVLTAAGAHLSDTERHVAETLAEEVFAIWRQYEDYYARLLAGGSVEENSPPPSFPFP